jgi:hypothetical protein
MYSSIKSDVPSISDYPIRRLTIIVTAKRIRHVEFSDAPVHNTFHLIRDNN